MVKKRKFMKIYDMYWGSLVSSIQDKVGRTNAEDITQDVFVAFYEKMNEVENPRQWLLGTLKNQLRHYFREKNKKITPETELDDINENIALSYVNSFRDTRIIIEEAIFNSNMPDREHAVFDMIALFNFRYKTTAKSMNLTEKQVKYYFKRATNRIKFYLQAKGIEKIEDLL